MADSERKLGKFETVAAVKVPHMPKSRTGFLRHLQTVAGVTEINRINRLCFEVLQFHGVVVLVAAAGEDHALVRFYAQRTTRMLGNQSDDLAI